MATQAEPQESQQKPIQDRVEGDFDDVLALAHATLLRGEIDYVEHTQIIGDATEIVKYGRSVL